MKILIEESVLRQALEALSNCEGMLPEYHQWLSDAQFELRTALDAAEKAEPSAEVVDLRADFPAGAIVPSLPVGTKLYLHPPTDEKLRRDADTVGTKSPQG